MKTNWDTKTVGKIASDMPVAAGLFGSMGIRACCDGGRVLGDVIKEEKLSGKEVHEALDKLKEKKPKAQTDDDFKAMKPQELADYIVYTFHAATWKAMPEVHDLLIAVLRTHGEKHPELKDIHELCMKLCSDLEEHLIDEETNVFPHLNRNDAKTKKARTPEVEHLMKEHRSAEKLFKQIRKTAKDYDVPSDACEKYKKLYKMLPEMEEQTKQHYHLEDDILFKEISDEK